MKIRFEGLSDKNSALKIGIYQQKEDYIVLKATVFPFMNIIWIGAIIMSCGFAYSIYRRRKKSAKQAE
jgi:cytochrome c-type biogenesis protein CcmF